MTMDKKPHELDELPEEADDDGEDSEILAWLRALPDSSPLDHPFSEGIREGRPMRHDQEPNAYQEEMHLLAVYTMLGSDGLTREELGKVRGSTWDNGNHRDSVITKVCVDEYLQRTETNPETGKQRRKDLARKGIVRKRVTIDYLVKAGYLV